MEFIQGWDLQRLIQAYASRGELMPQADVLRIGRAVADALDYAHLRGAIHRDVKPSNVLVSVDGRVLLTDFGLLLETGQGTRGEVFGSPHYIAPEQARSSAAAVPQSDLYSLGIMLYQLLVGVLPFDDVSPAALALKHVSQPPPAPRALNPSLNPEVEEVLLKAIRKPPEERFGTGKELLDQLERALSLDAQGEINPYKTEQLTPASPPFIEVEPSIPRTLSQINLDDFVIDLSPTTSPHLAPLKEDQRRRSNRRREYNLNVLGIGCVALIVLAALFIIVSGSLIRSLRERAGRPSEAFTSLPTVIGQGSLSTPVPTLSDQPDKTPESTLPPPAASPTPEPSPIRADEFNLLLVSFQDDSLFLINLGDIALPLTYLQLSNDKGMVTGSEWEVDALGPGQCVALWKEEGSPEAPQGVNCDRIGARVERRGPEKFWTEAFEVFYQGKPVGRCAGKNQPCTLRFRSSL